MSVRNQVDESTVVAAFHWSPLAEANTCCSIRTKKTESHHGGQK